MTLLTRGTRPRRLEEPFLSDVSWEVIQHCWAQEPPQRPRMKDVAKSMVDVSESAFLAASPTLSFTTTVRIPDS